MNNIFDLIAELVRNIFPKYTVIVEDVPDSPNTRSIAVYGVESNDTESIRNFINKLDWELCHPRGLATLPRIVNLNITETYYPQYIKE